MAVELQRIEHLQIQHVYQPMWNLINSHTFGYEALVRFPDMIFGYSIDRVFDFARAQGDLFELDTRSILNAISNFPQKLLEHQILFINIFPSTIINSQFVLFINHILDEFPQFYNKIVFELNETLVERDIWNKPELKTQIYNLKKMGFFIALDDFGRGAANFKKVIEFSPHFLKLDRYFANDLDTSKRKQKMVSFIVKYFEDKMKIILEGIERDQELEQALLLNIPIVQGYLLGRPQNLTT